MAKTTDRQVVNGQEYLLMDSEARTNIGSLNSSMKKYNSYDLWPELLTVVGTASHSGVAYTFYADKTVNADGRATSDSFRNVYANSEALPDGLVPGEPYYVKYASSVLQLRLIWQNNGSMIRTDAFTSDGVGIVPETANGAIIRVFTPNGSSVDETVLPVILTSRPNQYLTEETEICIKKILGSSQTRKAIDHGGFFKRASELYLQNSPLAFLRAANAGVMFHNLDIVFSSDGVPIVSHNKTVTDVNGNTVDISALTVDELKEISIGTETYSWTLQTLEEAHKYIEDLGGSVEMLDVSVTDPTNVANLPDYYKRHNLKIKWTACNALSDTSIFIENGHGYGVYIVCENTTNIEDAITYITAHPGTEFMLNIHVTEIGAANVESYVPTLVEKNTKIYAYLYSSGNNAPSWADGLLSETDNVNYNLYKKIVG